MISIFDNIGILSQSNPFLVGLQSYWRLDENTGTVVRDFGPSNYSGTTNNITWNSSGKKGNCIQCNTTDSNVYLADSNYHDYDITDKYSVQCWVKRIDITGGAPQMIFSKMLGSGNQTGYCAYFQVGANNVVYGIFYTVANRITKVTNDEYSSTSDWYHFVMTYSGTSSAADLLWYTNGVSAASTTANDNLTTTSKNSEVFRISGRAGVWGAGAYIDEVAVWNRVLTPHEIKQLYNAGSGIYY